MSSTKFKKDKEIIADYETQVKEIRNQLVEQFKCLEQQSESRIQLLQDLQEFFRRKAEIELEYSRSLEKLAERFSSKIRSSREHQQFNCFIDMAASVEGIKSLHRTESWFDKYTLHSGNPGSDTS
ncbi:hypothetical protein PAMP_017339 [Pampus punctatissimus]